MIDLRKHLPYLHDQGPIGCCASSAALHAAELMLNIKGNNIIFSRLFLYYMSRKISNRVGQKGSSVEDALKAFRDIGVCKEEAWPFIKKRENTEPNYIAKNQAQNYRINDFYNVGTDSFKDVLNSNIPIIAGMWTGRKFWKMKGKLEEQDYGGINDTDNRLSKGHAVTIIGYNDFLHNGCWIIANSLGLSWGDKGFGILPYSCNELIGESYYFTSVSYPEK